MKGPLADATVTVYPVDTAEVDLKGAAAATASTDASAAITGLALPFPLTPPYLLEFTSEPGVTTDITTGQAPIIQTLRTVITQEMLDAGEQIYATPLTTMAVDLAILNADSADAPFTGDADGSVSEAEFIAALDVAAGQVVSTVGFGLDDSIDIFDTPPLLDDTTDTTEEQADVAAYRAAVEALSAVVYQMNQQVGGSTPDLVLAELTADLADDNSIGGSVAGGVIDAEVLEVLDQDPAMLPIPGASGGETVGDVAALLAAETATTGVSGPTDSLTDGTIVVQPEPASTDPDLDDDGVSNAADDFPLNPAESLDTDEDNVGNNADVDDDNDGYPDTADAFPLDPTEHLDTDSDGTGNNADTDDDNDGVEDSADSFPLDASRSDAADQDGDGWPEGQDADDNDADNPGTPFVDTDGDGVGDATDDDDDNDGVGDAEDAFPLDGTEYVDTDADGTGDNADTDDDGDGVADVSDAFPLDPEESLDTDQDGIGNGSDTDDDGDGVSDVDEAINGTDPLLKDTDGDGRYDGSDAFPMDPGESVDTDGDGTGNNADTDDDADGLSDSDEAAAGTNPLVDDTDADGALDGDDAFPTDGTETVDTDGDGVGNNADTDDDGDGVADVDDTFPLDSSESSDADADGVGDNADNCPSVANPQQTDSDGDGTGDACEATATNAVWDEFDWDDGSQWQ